MTKLAMAVKSTGLVTSVGLSAPASCAAIRAKVSAAAESVFVDALAESIKVHEVQLPTQWRGRYRLVHMAALAILECLDAYGPDRPPAIPLYLCVAELERPGRLAGLDTLMIEEICAEAGIPYVLQSEVIAMGRVGAVHALARCRELMASGGCSFALVVAVDSLLDEETLEVFDRSDRLLAARQSNGFIPGEGAGAVLIGAPGRGSELHCTGLGLATEPAHIESDIPVRGDGLASAVRAALAEANCGIEDIDYRSADISGEHYYFKEAVLVMGRLLRLSVPEIDLWLVAESIGETGALAGVAMLVAADAAARKGYAPGPQVLLHMAADDGQRVAAVLKYWGG